MNYLLGANLNRMVSSFGELLLEANNAVSSISHGLSLLLRSKTPTLPAQPLLTCSKYLLLIMGAFQILLCRFLRKGGTPRFRKNISAKFYHFYTTNAGSKAPALPAQPLLTCSKYFLMLVIKTKYWILISLTIPETQYWIHFVTDNPWPHQVWWCRYSKKPTELWC